VPNGTSQRIGCVIAGLLLLAGAMRAQEPPSRRPESLLPPPRTDGRSDVILPRVETSLDGLRLELECTGRPPVVVLRAAFTDPGGHLRLESFEQRAGFWVTDACGFGRDAILVAGRDVPAELDVIERWELRVPSAAPARSAVEGAGALVAFGARRRVYADGARGPIRVVRPHPGPGARVLIQLWNDDSVATYDVEGGAFELLLHPEEGHGVPAVPELVGLRGDCWSGEHRVEGFVTYLGQRPDGRTFVLFDHDLDGVLDEWGAIDGDEVHERGLTAAGEWISLL